MADVVLVFTKCNTW